MKQKIILASSSPRRMRLLRMTGLKFEAIASRVKENADPFATPRKFVETLAFKKAFYVASKRKNGIIIGADTILVCNGAKLGKPKSKVQAFRMLKLISGRKIAVYSGVAIIDSRTGKKMVFSEKTALTINKLSDEEIRAYIQTKEPLGKAGAIAIQGQGAKFILKISGSTSNVIGLPLEGLQKNLRKFGVALSIPRQLKI
jgi:septum formation protein